MSIAKLLDVFYAKWVIGWWFMIFLWPYAWPSIIEAYKHKDYCEEDDDDLFGIYDNEYL